MNRTELTEPRDIRIWFSKTGTARHISHLDLLRSMTRAVRRAGIPIWYTEGFNKHPYLTFASPLSLGYEGFHESFDIRVMEEFLPGEIKAAISDVMPMGIVVTDVTYPVMKAGKITHAQYKIKLPFDERAADFMAQDSIIVKKKSKKGKIRELEIAPYVAGIKYTVDGDEMLWEVMLPASSADNINPIFLVSAFGEFIGDDSYKTGAEISRINLYCQDELFA